MKSTLKVFEDILLISNSLDEPLPRVLARGIQAMKDGKSCMLCLLKTGAKLDLHRRTPMTWEVVVISYAQGRKDVPEAWRGKVL